MIKLILSVVIQSLFIFHVEPQLNYCQCEALRLCQFHFHDTYASNVKQVLISYLNIIIFV